MIPKIFVFCNSCEPNWHCVQAMTEDGCFIASHVCSHHVFIRHDMGIDPDGWKRDIYAIHYPDGYEVVFEETPQDPSPEFKAACVRHADYTKKEYIEKMLIHKKVQLAELERVK